MGALGSELSVNAGLLEGPLASRHEAQAEAP